MAKSKFFRIAVEGGTTDGREIDRSMIEQAAANFNIATYTPRINCEHIRGFSPEGPFNAYGSVTAVKTEEVELTVDGKVEKRLALFGQIDPNDQLLAINKKDQKLFTSCEFAPNFGGTGKWGLVGLAVTDSPASLGTEMLKFAAGQGDNSPLAHRKQDKSNLFTASEGFTLEIEPEAEPAAEIKGLVALATEFFSKLTPKADDKPVETSSQPAPAPAQPVVPPANDNADAFAAMGGIVTKLAAAVEKTATDTAASVASLSAKVDDLTQKFGSTAAPSTVRPLATGTDNYARTDC